MILDCMLSVILYFKTRDCAKEKVVTAFLMIPEKNTNLKEEELKKGEERNRQ